MNMGSQQETYILQIQMQDNTKKLRSGDIAHQSWEFYNTLYNLRTQVTEQSKDAHCTTIQKYLRDSGLPQMSAQDANSLASLISAEEFSEAVKDMKPDRAPGPDGYTVS